MNVEALIGAGVAMIGLGLDIVGVVILAHDTQNVISELMMPDRPKVDSDEPGEFFLMAPLTLSDQKAIREKVAKGWRGLRRGLAFIVGGFVLQIIGLAIAVHQAWIG